MVSGGTRIRGGASEVPRSEEWSNKMNAILKRFNGEESGASLVEYGLLVGLIAVAAIAGLRLLGTNISAMFTTAGAQLNS